MSLYYAGTVYAVLVLMVGAFITGFTIGEIHDYDHRPPKHPEPDPEYWERVKSTVAVDAARIPTTYVLSMAAESRLVTA